MARRRMIDPGFWQSEDVAKLNIRQRLMLIGLFSNADDEGKLRGNPALIRSTIFPYEDFSLKEIVSDLEMVASIGSIILYEVESNKYIKLSNWNKFQRVDKPQPSLIPDPTIETVHEPLQEKNNNDSKNDSKNESGNGSNQPKEHNQNDSRLKEKKGKEVKRNISSSKDDQPNGSTLIAFYHDEFLKRFGAKPLINGGKHGKMLKNLLNTYPYEDIQKYILMYLDDKDDPFITGGGYTIEIFLTKIQKYILQKPKKKVTSQDTVEDYLRTKDAELERYLNAN